MSDPDTNDERARAAARLDAAALRAQARAYLEWEAELTGVGLPAHVPSTAVRAATAVSATEVVAEVSPATGVRSVPIALAAAPAENSVALSVPALAGATARLDAPTGDRRARLAQLDEQVRSCTRCALAQGRSQTVFARGNPDSPLVFIGEGPGQEEDRLGSPFVGPAGQLLDKMVAAMGFQRDDVYICNVVKCRPPGNRTPLPSEAGACAPFLLGQLDVIEPRVIVALGRCAAENLGLVEGGGWRGRWGKFRGVDVMPTYHPAFLLRSPEFKRPVWEDLQKVMSKLKGPD